MARRIFDLDTIVKQTGDPAAQLHSLAEPWANTGTSAGRLMIAVLGDLGDVERDLSAPHRRGPQPRAEARAAHGADRGDDRKAEAEARGDSQRRCGCRTRRQLPREHKQDFKNHSVATPEGPKHQRKESFSTCRNDALPASLGRGSRYSNEATHRLIQTY